MKEAEIRAIAKTYAVRGWEIVERKRRHESDGYAVWDKKTIYCLPLENTYALFVFLHEVGHIVSGHLGPVPSKDEPPDWLLEYEAEQFAIKAFKENGIPVSKEIMDGVRSNIAYQFTLKPESVDADDPLCKKALKLAFPKTWRDWWLTS